MGDECRPDRDAVDLGHHPAGPPGYKKAVQEGRAHGVSFRIAPVANWLVVGWHLSYALGPAVIANPLAERGRVVSEQYGSEPEVVVAACRALAAGGHSLSIWNSKTGERLNDPQIKKPLQRGLALR